MGQQTTTSTAMTNAIEGALADLDHVDIQTFVNEESSAEMPFGVMLGQGTLDSDALLLAASSDKLIGVLVHSQAYDKTNEIGTTGVKANMTLGVLFRGTIYVKPEEDVTPASEVRVRAIASGNEVKGAFRDTADDTTDCINISKFARYLDTIAAGAIGRVHIDMNGRNEAVADT